MRDRSNRNKRMSRLFELCCAYFTFFLATVSCAYFLHNPDLLQTPFYLAASIVSFLITTSQTLLNLEQAHAVMTYNSKIFSEQNRQQSFRSKLIFIIKNSMIVVTNILLLGATAFLLTYHSPIFAMQSITFALAHQALCLVRHYFNSPQALSSLDPISRLSSTVTRSSDTHLLNISMYVPSEILEKHQANCQFSQLPKHDPSIHLDELSYPESFKPILRSPVLLVNEQIGVKLWAEKDRVLRNATQLQNWKILDHSHEEVQQKIRQIRELLTTMQHREQHLAAQLEPFKSLARHPKFTAYHKSVSTALDQPEKTKEYFLHSQRSVAESHLKNLEKNLTFMLDFAEDSNISTATPALKTTEPYCAITTNPIAVPILITYKNPNTSETVDSFLCDLSNFIHWIDTNPLEHNENETTANDLATLRLLMNDLRPFSASYEQLQSVYLAIDSAPRQKTVNPIAVLTKTFGLDCADSLRLLLGTQYMRRRFHDTDLTSTLSSGLPAKDRYSSFNDYISRNDLLPLMTPLSQAYTNDFSTAFQDPFSPHTNLEQYLLFKKSWPLNRKPLISDEYDIELSLDLDLIQKTHHRSRTTIETTLAKQAADICAQLNPSLSYYIETDEALLTSTGANITTSSLLELSLHNNITAIHRSPGGYIPKSEGLYLFPAPKPMHTMQPLRPRPSAAAKATPFIL
jgi:hypothetical protein